jgi:hypothetical protein
MIRSSTCLKNTATSATSKNVSISSKKVTVTTNYNSPLPGIDELKDWKFPAQSPEAALSRLVLDPNVQNTLTDEKMASKVTALVAMVT